MTNSGTENSQDTATAMLRLPKVQQLAAPTGWHAYAIPVPDFPIKPETRGLLNGAIRTVLDRLRGTPPLELSVWLLMDSLHKEGAVRQLSRHGKEWAPEFGLGIWPDREPPRMYKDSDFLDLEFGQEMPAMMHSIVRIGGTEGAAREAWNVMFGLGSTIVTLALDGTDAVLDAVRDALTRRITDESFQSFAFYFPLIGTAALAQASVEEMDEWMGPVQVYARESEEDRAVLLLSRSNAVEALKAAGFIADSQAEDY
ncbi:MAG TPA: hypothetical protein VK608_15910 [Edaphobacter sp.]|nr:hypothetical protein [Edaphobacter sp.]